MNVKEIREFKEYQVKRHSGRVKSQKEAQSYFEDTYLIPFVKKKYEVRTGFVSEMCNSITQQAVGSMPKVYTIPKKDTKNVQDSADRVASLFNKWVKILSKQSENPFKKSFKSVAFSRGEAWVYTPHRAELIGKGEERKELMPVHFILYDPMVVFADPSEFVDGKPTRLVVSYKRKVGDIKANYPFFTYRGEDGELLDFFYYVDKENMYAEAGDGESMQSLFRDSEGNLIGGDGRRPNIYGFLNFSHCYSGFGQDTEDHDPAMLAFNRTRMVKDRVLMDSTMASAFRWNVIEFAWKARTLLNQSGQIIGPDVWAEYRPNEPGKFNVLNLPPGADVKVEESQLFDPAVFAYWSRLKADLESAYPGSIRGQAQGTSGRQEDILSGAGLAFYDGVVENLTSLWETAFDNALKVCYKLKEFDMIPQGLQSDDIDSYSEITVKVKAEDPLETLRKQADGDRKYQLGIIDDMTNLTEYQGYTKEEAKSIIAHKLVDDVTRNHPVIRELMGITLAREMGVMEEFGQISAQMGGAEGVNPPPQFGSQGGEPREGNVKTQMGREMPDMSARKPVRRSPGG